METIWGKKMSLGLLQIVSTKHAKTLYNQNTNWKSFVLVGHIKNNKHKL